MSAPALNVRNHLIARRVKRAGVRQYALRIALEARRAKLPVSLAYAVIHQETGGTFRNEFGHDRGALFSDNRAEGRQLQWVPVTHARVQQLLHSINMGRVSNGVGLPQLTFPPFIHKAELRGGAHVVKHQLSVAFEDLSALIAHYGSTRMALAHYNAGNPHSPAGLAYAERVLALQKHYRALLA